MKAIRRYDGKVIDVIEFSPREFIETVDQTGDGRKIYTEGQVVLLEDVDWDAFRREAAKDILAGIATNIQIYINEQDRCKVAVHDAIALADELVKQLKNGR